MNLSKKSKANIMRKIGYRQGDYRRSHNLCLAHVAKQSGVPWQMIDALERGNNAQWNAYSLLLEFYGKSISIELVERSGSGKSQPIDESVKAKYRRQEPVVHNRVTEYIEKQLDEDESPNQLMADFDLLSESK